MCGGVMPALVGVVRAIGAKGGSQGFAVDTDTVVPAASTCELDSGRFAHHMHYVQGTFGLRGLELVWKYRAGQLGYQKIRNKEEADYQLRYFSVGCNDIEWCFHGDEIVFFLFV